MEELFEQIKKIAPSIVYLSDGKGANIPCPPDTATEKMIFIEANGYTVGFTEKIDDKTRLMIIALLPETLEMKVENLKSKITALEATRAPT